MAPGSCETPIPMSAAWRMTCLFAEAHQSLCSVGVVDDGGPCSTCCAKIEPCADLFSPFSTITAAVFFHPWRCTCIIYLWCIWCTKICQRQAAAFAVIQGLELECATEHAAYLPTHRNCTSTRTETEKVNSSFWMKSRPTCFPFINLLIFTMIRNATADVLLHFVKLTLKLSLDFTDIWPTFALVSVKIFMSEAWQGPCFFWVIACYKSRNLGGCF